MPTETPISKSAPTPEEIGHQVDRLCDDPLLKGALRSDLLRWLIEYKIEGKYKLKPRPHAKAIFSQFYDYAIENFGASAPAHIEDTGKKLFYELAKALQRYYQGPGANDNIKISLKGAGRGYEPEFEQNLPKDHKDLQAPKSETVETFSALPRERIVEQIENGNCGRVRISITCIIDFPQWELFKALSSGARVELLFSHPECRFVELRGEALRKDALRNGDPVPWKPSEVVRENLNQLRSLIEHFELPAELKNEALTVKLTDEFMPVGLIQVDGSIYFSPYWNGLVVFGGRSFAAQTDSATGKFLDGQFSKLWNAAQRVDLSKPGFPSC
jgi:hypothetical protein